MKSKRIQILTLSGGFILCIFYL